MFITFVHHVHGAHKYTEQARFNANQLEVEMVGAVFSNVLLLSVVEIQSSTFIYH